MRKKTLLIIIVIVIALLSLPAILSSMMTLGYFSKALGSADGWLSYWGGYLGAMLGLAAISVTTQLQINSQNQLHEKQINSQNQLNEEQMRAQEKSMLKMHESQKELQKRSIDESTKANDKKERDRIYMNLLIHKNEDLIENLIELNFLISKRYNILRDYVYYESLKRELEGEINSEFERSISSSSRLGKILSNDEMKLRKQKLVIKIDEIKQSETEFRIKTSDISAKIKTRSMYFKGLNQQINAYRIIIDSSHEEFYTHIEKEDINLNDFSMKIEERWEEIHRLTNQILNLCQENLLEIINGFVNYES